VTPFANEIGLPAVGNVPTGLSSARELLPFIKTATLSPAIATVAKHPIIDHINENVLIRIFFFPF
jgi:hypothetical protein